MQLKSFQYFIAIAENATLSAAADSVLVSQPALSQQIRKIEEEVGATLFRREGHSMELTPAGEVFLQCARRILQSYEAMKREVQVLDQAAQDTVRMGISPFYSQHYLPMMLPRFLEQYPEFKVDILEDISVNLEKKLLAGELDFCALPLYPKNDLLEYETIYQENILLAIPRNHPLNAHYPADVQSSGGFPHIDLSLLKNEAFIGLKKIQKFSHIGLRLCEEAGFVPNTVCETLNWETVHMLVASGLGVGFIPEILTEAITDPDIRPCYYQVSSNVYRAYAIAQRPGTVLSRPAVLLTSILREFFRNRQQR